MAEKIMSFVGTTSKKLPDLPIKNAQLIFIKDKRKLALDLDNKRTFYNDVTMLSLEKEREELIECINESFYFVIETAVLWFYKNGWNQITYPPQEFIFVDAGLPEFGMKNTLYIDRENQCVSIWDEKDREYISIGEKTKSVPISEIDKLFI